MVYCVYITTYTGKLLPPKYIGSSSIKRVKKRYRGSVSSKRWKNIWNEELRVNPSAFFTEIISTHHTREEALQEELRLQLLYDVVNSSDWINESYAQPMGFAGRNVSGELNPMYKNGDKLSEWIKNNPDKVSDKNRKAAITQWKNDISRNQKIEAMRNKKKTRKTQTQEEFVLMQTEKGYKSREKCATKIEFNGKIYTGWPNLLHETGVTKHLYNKYYLNGINPLERKGACGPIKK